MNVYSMGGIVAMLVVGGIGGVTAGYLDNYLARRKLTPTIAWLNATYAVITAVNTGTWQRVGGMNRHLLNKFLTRGMLRGWWDIRNKQQALETVDTLFTGMHNTQFLEEVKSAGIDQMTAASFENVKKQYDEPTRKYLEFLYDGYQKFGEKACMGWDLGRGNYLLGSYYISGYLSRDESLDRSLEFGKKIQSLFTSWDEYLDSYMFGYLFWQHNGAPKISGEYKERLGIIERQKKKADGPYAREWYTKLTKDWS